MDTEKKQLNLLEEDWARWEPFTELKPAYDIINIQDDMDYLRILIHSTKCDQQLEVVFDTDSAYRKTDETFRLNLINQLSEKYGDEFYVKWSFFKIENSNYMKWLSEQSNGYTGDLKLKHFVIMGIDSIVDIVAYEEPKFKLLE